MLADSLWLRDIFETQRKWTNCHFPHLLRRANFGERFKMAADSGIRVAIDRGGTFCDVIAYIPERDPLTFKLLSEDPENYLDAPTEAIRRVLEIAEGRKIAQKEALDGSRIGEP